MLQYQQMMALANDGARWEQMN